MPEGQWLESPSSGPLFAEFSIREFIVEERDHQPVLSEIALPEGWMAAAYSKSPSATMSYTFLFTAPLRFTI